MNEAKNDRLDEDDQDDIPTLVPATPSASVKSAREKVTKALVRAEFKALMETTKK